MRTFRGSGLGDRLNSLLDKVANRERRRLYFELVGLDFAKVESLLDDTEQVFGGCFDLVNVFQPQSRDRRFLQELRENQDRICRGTQFCESVQARQSAELVSLEGSVRTMTHSKQD